MGDSFYDTISAWHIANRQQHIGIEEVEKFTALLQAGATILDLGCGHGLPMSKYLVEKGYDVYAIDNSQQLIAAYKINFPGVPVACEDIQDSSLFNKQFHGIIAYGVLFFLSEEDQKTVLHNISKALLPNGLLLFTASKESIIGISTMAELEFPYISLGLEQYVNALRGMSLVSAYPDAWDNFVYLFKKC